MAAPPDRKVSFSAAFQLRVGELGQKQMNQSLDLPPVVMVHNDRHIKVAPFVYPSGIRWRCGKDWPSFLLRVMVIDDEVLRKMIGEVEVKATLLAKEGASMAIKTKGYPGPQEHCNFIGQLESGKNWQGIAAAAKNGAFSDGKVRLEIRMEAPVKVFEWERYTVASEQQEKRPYGDMLQDVVSGQCRSFPDFLIKSSVDGSEHRCHRSVLALSSEYFCAMFRTESDPGVKRVKMEVVEQAQAANKSLATLSQDFTKFRANYSTKIERTSSSAAFSGGVLSEVLHWVYKGETTAEKLSSAVAVELVAAADFFLLPGLKDICEKRLIETLSEENAWERLKLSDKFKLKVLENSAMAVLVDSAGVLKQARVDRERGLEQKLADFFQEAARAHKTFA